MANKTCNEFVLGKGYLKVKIMYILSISKLKLTSCIRYKYQSDFCLFDFCKAQEEKAVPHLVATC